MWYLDLSGLKMEMALMFQYVGDEDMITTASHCSAASFIKTWVFLDSEVCQWSSSPMCTPMTHSATGGCSCAWTVIGHEYIWWSVYRSAFHCDVMSSAVSEVLADTCCMLANTSGLNLPLCFPRRLVTYITMFMYATSSHIPSCEKTVMWVSLAQF